ncbi:MAG: hypothetical protein Q9174_000087 [Haloplaca sp. 1 TL-2023]
MAGRLTVVRRAMEESGFSSSSNHSVEEDRQDEQSPGGHEYPDPDTLSAVPLWKPGPFATSTDTFGSNVLRDQEATSYNGVAYHDIAAMGSLDECESDVVYEHIANTQVNGRDSFMKDRAFEPLSTDDSGDRLASEFSESSSESQSLSRTSAVRNPRRRKVGRKASTHSLHQVNRTRRSQKGIKRGPRKAMEPGQAFKTLYSRATSAFFETDYEAAEKLVLGAIRENSEMYRAYSLLAEIYTAQGEDNKALTALFTGAHTKPRDLKVWLSVGQLFLARVGVDGNSALAHAHYCYTRIVSLDPDNTDHRRQRAILNRDLGHNGRAARDYERLLIHSSHDFAILQSLAEIYTDLGRVSQAIKHYDAAIKFYQVHEPERAKTMTWSDINIYVELFADQGQYDEAIEKLRFLTCWILGLRGDTVAEDASLDDRDWVVQILSRQAGHRGVASQESDGLEAMAIPIELRVKLGIYRLKASNCHVEIALSHFDILGADKSSSINIKDFPDLFRDAADALLDASLYSDALRYYEPLQHTPSFATASYFSKVALCYQAVGKAEKAEEFYRRLLSRQATMAVDDERPEQRRKKHNVDYMVCDDYPSENESDNAVLGAMGNGRGRKHPSLLPMLVPQGSKPSTKRQQSDRRLRAKRHGDTIRTLYRRTQELLDRARTSDAEALVQWMAATQELVEDFQSHRAFFPHDRGPPVYGRSALSTFDHGRADNPQHSPEIPTATEPGDAQNDPAALGDYREIPLSSWLDLMLEYAVLLARSDSMDKAYEVLNVVNGANVFYSSADSMFRVHVCWFACALVNKDEKTLCNVARWFMKEFQFVTDGYRLFSAVHRLCDGRDSWFNCGASQKFVLRQLKAMDAAASHRDLDGSLRRETIENHQCKLSDDCDMDQALLMLYGYILYLGRSFSLALRGTADYFFRAFALDPDHPIINLSLALAYIQHAIKRQSDDRHRLVTQGLMFLFRYHSQRKKSHLTSEREEADFNVARTYHMLGLTHLAIPYYQLCVLGSSRAKTSRAPKYDDFSVEAAFAMQSIWIANGDMATAMDITRKHLVI